MAVELVDPRRALEVVPRDLRLPCRDRWLVLVVVLGATNQSTPPASPSPRRRKVSGAEWEESPALSRGLQTPPIRVTSLCGRPCLYIFRGPWECPRSCPSRLRRPPDSPRGQRRYRTPPLGR